MLCVGCKRFLIYQYCHEPVELFAHEVYDGLFVMFASGFERVVIAPQLRIVHHTTEGGLEEGCSGNLDSSF